MNKNENDQAIRLVLFAWLEGLERSYGDMIPRTDVLEKGMPFGSGVVHVIGPRGIFKPSQLALPISLTTTPNSPYNDSFSEDGLLEYNYQASDKDNAVNRGMRSAMEAGVPLVYFHGVVPNRYTAVWPVYIHADNYAASHVLVGADDKHNVLFGRAEAVSEEISELRRRYITTAVKTRSHQKTFRERVLAAYYSQCGLCRLKHVQLLEAAHITPDADSRGEPLVSNGMSLCKIHHAAFDHNILGIRPDLQVEVRVDVLEEVDGPMLLHGIQAMHGTKLAVPSRRKEKPDSDRLEERYKKFRAFTI